MKDEKPDKNLIRSKKAASESDRIKDEYPVTHGNNVFQDGGGFTWITCY